MATMTPMDQYKAVQLLASIQQLLLLDAVWTRLHEGHHAGNRDETQVLGQLGRDMDRLLARIHADVPMIRLFLEGNADSTYAAFTRLVSGARIDEGTRQGLRKKIATARGFADQLSRSVQTIVDETARERRDIETKMRAVSAGGTSPGDISKGTKCALLLAGIGLGAITTVVGSPLLGGFFLGAYGGMFVDEC